MREPELQILLPIHNEADSIEQTVREIHESLGFVSHEFIFCEDGSRDNTKAILRRLAEEIPAKLLLSDTRKGYSRAVRDGMFAADAPYLLCLDSDGQCDPRDIEAFWNARRTADVLMGWRVKRADGILRRLMSGFFFVFWKAVFAAPVHDPSCPFVLTPLAIVRAIACELGEMEQGFWWEYVARIYRRGWSIREFPVHHRERAAGVTQVYRLKKLPGIGYRHFRALFRIHQQTQQRSAAPAYELRTGESQRVTGDLSLTRKI
jgi:dolichol-phosphate mannosyltransferase